MDTKVRRYDLDWLRVLVFGLLIFYHAGMFFVPWGWHIKNNEIITWIKWPMLFLNQWRLPILFVISGMGTYYALSFRNNGQFIWERLKRLGLPLVFGMLLIVPPQIYIERIAYDQFRGSYIDFLLTRTFNTGPYPEGNLSWHHLWFLPYLLIFSVLLSPLFIYLKSRPTKFVNWIQKIISKTYGLYIFIIPLYLAEAFLEPFFPVTHALIDDWFNFISSLFLFFMGFILISAKEIFWISLSKLKSKALIIGIAAFLIQLTIWIIGKDGVAIHFTEAWIKVINLWSWILVIFGYGAQYLNHKSKAVSYCNRAVYPFYILHQTVMIIIAYYLMNLQWNFFIKFTIIIVGTFSICWVIYEFIILRLPILHPLFGLKKSPKTRTK